MWLGHGSQEPRACKLVKPHMMKDDPKSERFRMPRWPTRSQIMMAWGASRSSDYDEYQWFWINKWPGKSSTHLIQVMMLWWVSSFNSPFLFVYWQLPTHIAQDGTHPQNFTKDILLGTACLDRIHLANPINHLIYNLLTYEVPGATLGLWDLWPC